MKKITTVSIKV